MTIEPSILLHVKGTFLGEGALWHAPSQVLYWVDISWPTVYRYDLKTGESKAYPMPSSVGAVVVRDSGGLIVALEDGFAHLDESTGNMTMLVPVEADMANTRFNDGKCDPAGRFLTPPPPKPLTPARLESNFLSVSSIRKVGWRRSMETVGSRADSIPNWVQ